MKRVVTVLLLLCGIIVAETAQGQITWTLQYAQDNPSSTEAITRSDVLFIDASTGWACGTNGMLAGAIFKTTDGGQNWDVIKSTSMFDSFNDFEYIDANTMWAAGSKGMGSDCLLYKTTDGGANWNVQSFPLNEAIAGIQFTSADVGYAFTNVSYVPKIYKTTDAGANWTEVFNGTTTDGWSISKVYSYFVIDENNIYAAGQSGHAFRSTDGGSTWNYVDNNTNANITGIYFTDVNTGWMVGASDVMMTTDGTTWTVVDIDHANVSFQDICFTDANTGYLVGGNADAGLSYSTTDGGATWTADVLSSDYDLLKLFFLDANTGWAVGKKGVVHMYSSGGTTPIEHNQNQIPREFELKQNYPNPFNPETNIEFSIPATSFVQLDVYNVLGQRVATLVSENLPAGVHKAYWNAANMSSGIYFYRLQAENFNAMNKMMLIK
ncbi:YCF48-related protein [candidate division KSB1 bacterium]